MRNKNKIDQVYHLQLWQTGVKIEELHFRRLSWKEVNFTV